MALAVQCWWLEQENGEIEKRYLQELHMKRRRRKQCEYEKVSEALLLWFVQQRKEGT